MSFNVTILGTSSATPAYNRHPSAQVVNIGDDYFLVDCGEGTQMQFSRYKVKWNKISHIFITHLHGDHYFGLIGLITSFSLNKREKPLHIYCPPYLENILKVQLGTNNGNLSFELIFHHTQPETSELIFENKMCTVETIILQHRIPCTGFLFKEKLRKRKMIKEKIDEYGIPFTKIPSIKEGADYELENGQIIKNAELTNDPLPPRSFAYCSDTAYKEDIVPQLKGVNLLYHESTFTEEDVERAAYTQHSTAIQAATIAKMAEAKKLLLGHFSARHYDLTPFLTEAQTVFENTIIAKEGMIVEVEY